MAKWIARNSALGILVALVLIARATCAKETISASSTHPGFSVLGPRDTNRFSTAAEHAWSGSNLANDWTWQTSFPETREVGAILQIQGGHEFVFRNAPRSYIWQTTRDGHTWTDLPSTRTTGEEHTFRLHRFKQSIQTRGLRLLINAVSGDRPVLREVEFFSAPNVKIDFPEWIVIVNTTHDPRLPNHGREFLPLAKTAHADAPLEAQQIWLDAFNPTFVAVEPRPLCAFLSGSFKDWCEVSREPFRGTEQILKQRSIPIWASCGGAQALGILAETGVDKPWDCPHCRDAQKPKLPIYGHIAHKDTSPHPCGNYSSCVFELGKHTVRTIHADPVLKQLPTDFDVMESHCGQLEWTPKGWTQLVTAAPGTLTKMQCMKLNNFPIYAAQFHIEMLGTPASSKTLMENFLNEARKRRH